MPSATITVEYDERGRETRILHNDGLSEVITTYDGNITERTTLLLGMIVSRQRTLHDDHGLVLSEESTGAGRTQRARHQYVFNERGDWIERLSYVDDSTAPSLRMVRAITYRD